MSKTMKTTVRGALKELESIVESLESKDLDVQEGLERFKKGAELIKFCRSELKKTENEFTRIKEDLEKEG